MRGDHLGQRRGNAAWDSDHGDGFPTEVEIQLLNGMKEVLQGSENGEAVSGGDSSRTVFSQIGPMSAADPGHRAQTNDFGPPPSTAIWAACSMRVMARLGTMRIAAALIGIS